MVRREVPRVVGMLCISLVTVALAQERPGGPGAQRPGPLPLDGARDRPGGRMQRPSRDARDVPTGTSIIRGRVVAADTGTPLRRVQVRAMSGELRESRLASTDAQGRFELRDLPAGRWNLIASKGGFVTLQFGQKRPFESGRPIELGEAETMAKADFALPRGGVITGRVMDEFGDPVANAHVVVMRYQSFQGTRRLVPTGNGDSTDDTGAYRLYGLSPGDYYVSATLRAEGFADDAQNTTAYAPTYYPGTGNVAEAGRVAVPVGQEVQNISFALLPVRAVRITGTITDSKGERLTNGFVMLQESVETAPGAMMMMRSGGRVRPDGSFTIANVSPGSYTLMVNTSFGPRDENAESASVPITVGNEDVTGINVVTDKGVTVTGRIVTADGVAGKLSMAGLTVFPQAPRFEPMMGFGPGRVEADGTFRISGLRGRRLFRLNGLPPSWTVKAVMLNGTDITDTAIEFKNDSDASEVQIVVTDRVSEINGKVTDAKGQPTRDYTVIVFPDDPAKWTFPSRYVRSGRADQQGLFKIRALPPEDNYLAVAVDYLEEGEGGDPEFLAEMKDRATNFRLGDGEVKALSLTLISR